MYYLEILISEFSGKIFKDRIKNSDNQKGKSSGYRIIYYVDHPAHEVYLLCLYSKNQKEDIHKTEIRQILRQLDL